ncbi:LysR family transcriptional regulator [Devosia sp. 919]|uniref:LysR family transcriptional regulator n=1 Tax=Devosia sp. 919 TaxID=2726065 RepID=UPI0015538661|nr:LysR family transcriptional regulator [Devosia sp. 919]
MKSNLRHLRTFLSAVETGSITRAAELNNVSQPAVTQAIRKLEHAYGMPLFQRTARGLFTSEAGQILARRVRRALDRLDRVLTGLSSRLSLTATTSQLTALIAAVDAQNFSLAARRLSLAQPTVHRAIAELELECGKALFERTSGGMIATRAAIGLAQAAELAFSELAQAEAELGALFGREVGEIVVGAMPLSRATILPAAIARFREQFPTLPIKAVEGPYCDLLTGLLRGKIDLLIGALRYPAPVDDLEQELLFEDGLSVVCGPNHPMRSDREPTLGELARYPWVVSAIGTPSRAVFDRIFCEGNAPPSLVETSSVMLMRELLAVSDHLGFVSSGQIISDVRLGSLVELPAALPQTTRAIGIGTRKGWEPTRAQSHFLDAIRHASAQLHSNATQSERAG